VPQQDKQYLIGIAQLPDGASLDRTTEVIRKLSDAALQVPGVRDSVAFPGLSIDGFTNRTNAGIVFFGLTDFDKRTTKALSADAIAAQVNMRAAAIKDAFIFVLNPPPVSGIGQAGGFKLQLLDRNSLGEQALAGAVGGTLGRVYGNPQSVLTQVFSNYEINVPQLYADIDRTRAKQMGVNLTDIYDTMQLYLGSLYVNDFNRFGKTYQVIVQADAPYRADAASITQLKTRNSRGEMVPLGALMRVVPTFGPVSVTRQSPATARGRRRPRSSACWRRACRAGSPTTGPSSCTRRRSRATR
jgi:multidrug efflux pump